jgi:pyruvate/2-oxoacid:ferredoxin oxidoreductase alpha subunit
VRLPPALVKPGLPAWAVPGDAAHRQNVVTSILLKESDLEAHNRHLVDKYARIAAAESRAEPFCCDDAEVLVVACNTPARIAKGAVQSLRRQGVAAGLFRPQTLWPFPIAQLLPILERVRTVVVVEASDGQLEDELRLALSHAGAGGDVEIRHVRRFGGFLPSHAEIVSAVRDASARKAVRA